MKLVSKTWKVIGTASALACVSSAAMAFTGVESLIVPMVNESNLTADQIILKNDGFNDQGGQAYLQTGFVSGEKAGIWVRVPSHIKNFKVDYFRVLMGSAKLDEMQPTNVGVFFQMSVSDSYSPGIPGDIENAAQVTPGPFWNDIPAQGDGRQLPCAKGGELVGASLEFTHQGAPSVYRDIDGLGTPQGNNLFAIPGGWNYSVAYGLRGDWVLRVVGHEAADGECN